MAPENLKILYKGAYVLVEFFGEFSVAEGKRCVDRMVEACDKHRCAKVFTDYDEAKQWLCQSTHSKSVQGDS